MNFLFFILIFALGVGLFILVFFASLLRSVFGIFRQKDSQGEVKKKRSDRKYKKKKIDKQEGEYVDFEEVKES